MQNIARTEALTSRDAWHARPNTVRGFGVFTLRLSSRSCNHGVFIENEIYTYLLSVSRPIDSQKPTAPQVRIIIGVTRLF